MKHITMLKDRSSGLEAVIVVVVPLVFGAITGIMLGVSEPVYLVLSLLGILGGFAAGLEHESALEGFYRGLLGGLLFGFGILLAHGIAGVEAKAELLEPEVVLIAITATFGAGLGALGGRVRARSMRRASSSPRAAATA
jgi:NO-binding membrane sensor protein with MHYT domain